MGGGWTAAPAVPTQFTALSFTAIGPALNYSLNLADLTFPPGTTLQSFTTAVVNVSGVPGHVNVLVTLEDTTGLPDWNIEATVQAGSGAQGVAVIPLTIGSDTLAMPELIINNLDVTDFVDVDVILYQGPLQPISFAVRLLDAKGINEATIDAQGGLSVAGEAANGTPVSGNPVPVAGYDGTDVRTLLTDTSGRLTPEPATATIEHGSNLTTTSGGSSQFGPTSAVLVLAATISLAVSTATAGANFGIRAMLQAWNGSAFVTFATVNIAQPTATANDGNNDWSCDDAPLPAPAEVGGVFQVEWIYSGVTPTAITGVVDVAVTYR